MSAESGRIDKKPENDAPTNLENISEEQATEFIQGLLGSPESWLSLAESIFTPVFIDSAHLKYKHV